jgi:hypothetical protein
MVDEGDGFALCGSGGIGGAKEVDGEVGVETALEVQGEVKIKQRRIGSGLEAGALFRSEPGKSAFGRTIRCSF